MKEIIENNTDSQNKISKVTTSILDTFDLLKGPKDDVKINGGSKLIYILRGVENEKDIQYVLKRLIRSLGANIPENRTGYFATLVALLKNFDKITTNEILEIVKKELHSSSSSKSEVGDVALGQLLVFCALIRSGLIWKSTEQEQIEVIQRFLTASKKKSYLSSVAYHMLLDFCNELDEEKFANIVWTNVKAEFKKDLKEYNLDSLYFLIKINQKFPNKVHIRKLIGVSDVLCEDNIHTLCEKLMSGIDFNSVNHPVFKEVGSLIANSTNLSLFWTSGIDSQLVKHKRNRELVAINLLSAILENIDDNTDVIPDLISKNFFKLLMDWFKGLQTASKIRSLKDNEDDHKLMIKKHKELLNTLCKTLKSPKVKCETRIKILKQLLFYPGGMNFTEISGTNIVKSTISDLDKHGVKSLAKLLKEVLLNTTKKYIKENVERDWFTNERLKAAELISYLVTHNAVKDNTKFKLTYMKLLMCLGFFGTSEDDSVAINSELSGSIKSCFYRCCSSRFSNVDSLVEVLSSLNNTLQTGSFREKLEKKFTEENVQCWEMIMEICKEIEEAESKQKVDKVFLILLYQLGLFLFSEPDHVKMAKSSIQELKSCYEHYKKEKKKSKKSIKKDKISVDEPEWIEVLTEVLLAILSTESSVLRSVVQCVFRLLCEYLTPSSIGQVVSVLDPDSESNPLSVESDSDGDDDKSESNDDEEMEKENSDEEMEKEDNDEDSQSDSEVDDEDEELKPPDQLKIAVQKALGTAADSDNESIDADMIDEEEGKRLDEALAEAFKQFHQGKNKKSKKDRIDKKALSDFRIRVLDLVDIYLEKAPSMDICLTMIGPLTRCLEFCIQNIEFAELENRVRKTIKCLTKIRKFSTTDDITIDILCEHLKAILDKGTRSHFMYQAMGDVITHFTTFIIHCAQKIEGSILPLIEILKEAIFSYFHNRNCMLPIIFFHNIFQTEWVGNYELIPAVIENIFSVSVRQFRRNEGVELIAGFYRSLKRSVPTAKKFIAKLKKIEATFENTLKSALQESSFEAKNNFIVLLKKLLNTMKSFHESCKIASDLDINSLTNMIASYKYTIKSKSANEVQNDGTESNNVDDNKSKRSKGKKRKLDKAINGHHSDVKKAKVNGVV